MKTKPIFLKIFMFLAATLLIMAGTAMAARQGNPGNHLGQNLEKTDTPEPEKVWPGDPDRFILMGLDLTDEQKTQIKEALTIYWAEVKEIKLQIIQLETGLVEEFLKEDTTPEALKAIQIQISELKAQLDMKKLELLITLKGISPKLAEMIVLKIRGTERLMGGNPVLFPPGLNKFENGLPPGQDD